MSTLKTAFVTGATGFLGTNLVRQLAASGVTVHALKRATSNTAEFDGLDIHWHNGDVTQQETLLAGCPDKVDAFFHVAADTSLWRKKNAQQDRINLTGTENAITTALQKHAKRFIHTSSIAAYGVHEDTITEATLQLGEMSFCNYYRTKHLSEKLVRDAVQHRQLDAVILNPCHLVGAPDYHNWSQMMRMVKNKTLPGVPPGVGSFCDIKEVAKAHIRAYDSGRRGENYILSGDDMSFVQFIQEIGALVGETTPSKAMPAWVLQLVGQLSALWANVTGKEPDVTPEKAFIVSDKLRVSSAKAQQELGYNASIPVKEPLADCLQWLMATGKM
jgi:nucleoside-diphosphate-sugar epimerase